MGNNHSDGDWIGIIICYIIFWPLGLFLLLRKLLKGKLLNLAKGKYRCGYKTR